METIAKAKMIRIAPRKTRLVINLIRGKNVNDALAILENQNQKAALILKKVLNSANIMTGADIVLNKLKDKFEFIVVTSRNDFETEIAKKKFKELGLENIKIFNNEHHKIDRLIEENADYMIDDDDTICINAADNNVCALYFKNNASNKVEKENVINVNNWGEIYKYLILNEGDN